jgi:hypothetical protein
MSADMKKVVKWAVIVVVGLWLYRMFGANLSAAATGGE